LSARRTVTLVVLPPMNLKASLGSAGKPVLTWPTALGKRYQLQYSDDLGTGAWVIVSSELAGTGIDFSFELTPAEASVRFYRLAVLP
jgi:hypothetical protein